MSVLHFALDAFGMPENEIADVKAAMPVTEAILDEAAGIEPIIDQMRPHITALIPLAVAAWPIIQKMWPQIVAETPVAKEIVEFVRSKI